ncbi:hypothetical protein HDU97_002874 [Phlyctochytrium planicorne]|nr:hypothetical protein HDU97_002874 [Phlyctochytrium planicorne]
MSITAAMTQLIKFPGKGAVANGTDGVPWQDWPECLPAIIGGCQISSSDDSDPNPALAIRICQKHVECGLVVCWILDKNPDHKCYLFGNRIAIAENDHYQDAYVKVGLPIVVEDKRVTVTDPNIITPKEITQSPTQTTSLKQSLQAASSSTSKLVPIKNDDAIASKTDSLSPSPAMTSGLNTDEATTVTEKVTVFKSINFALPSQTSTADIDTSTHPLSLTLIPILISSGAIFVSLITIMMVIFARRQRARQVANHKAQLPPANESQKDYQDTLVVDMPKEMDDEEESSSRPLPFAALQNECEATFTVGVPFQIGAEQPPLYDDSNCDKDSEKDGQAKELVDDGKEDLDSKSQDIDDEKKLWRIL